MEKISKEIKTGDVFYTSWGYDQTNYDYIVVVELSKTGKSAICKMAKCETLGTSGQTYIQKPISEGYGDSFRMWIRKGYRGDTVLRGSYPFCDGDMDKGKRLDTFLKHEGDRVYHETDSQFGH